MTYVPKNYSDKGGDRLVIGGELELKEGAGITGFPSAENQLASTATKVADLAADFNSLLIRLKDAGIMIPDAWNITAGLAPTPTDEVVAGNNALVQSVTHEDGVITVAVDVDALTESASSVPEQGTHKWIALDIGTGHESIVGVKYNGVDLTQADADEASSVGCAAGHFVLYIKTEIVAEENKPFTLKAAGYPEETITITITVPE